MRKFLLSILILVFAAFSINAQVLSSDFEAWGASTYPTGWGGGKTNIGTTNVIKYTTNVHGGVNACQLINSTTSHKRFSSVAKSITEGTSYKVSFWVRGHGDIRTGLFTGKATTASGYLYGSYISVNASTWAQYEQTLTADTTTSLAEFIFSVKGTNVDIDNLQIDDIDISETTIQFTDVSIYDIQYTTDPSGDSPYKDQVINVKGLVTSKHYSYEGGTYQGFFIQDGDSAYKGIYVYDGTKTPNVGDSVTIKATVVEFNGVLTELKTIIGYTVNSTGNTLPSPVIVTATQAKSEGYEGVLIQIKFAKCTSAPGQYNDFTINDGTSDLNVDDDIYKFVPTLNSFYDITGLGHYAYGLNKILPRSSSDVVVSILNTDAEIIDFSFAEQTGAATINSTSGTVSIDVFSGTVLTSLVPTIVVSSGATINPASGVSQDFTTPKTYTVTAQDGTTSKIWTVTVVPTSTLNNQAEILTFSFPSDIQAGTSVINSTAGTISVDVFPDVDKSSLTPTITISAFATVNPANGTQNFTSPFTYTVTAQDGTPKTWTVTVTNQTFTSIYDIQYTTATIADSPLKNQIVTIKGVVTAQNGLTDYYIQEASGEWRGINVVHSGGLYSIGDSIFVTGTVAESNYFTYIKDVSSSKLIISFRTVDILNKTASQVKLEAFESVVVTINNAICVELANSYGEWKVYDGTDTLIIDDVMYAPTIALDKTYKLTGVIKYSYGNFVLLPRKDTDVGINSLILENYNINIYPNPVSDKVTITNNSDIQKITLFNILGSKVLEVSPFKSNLIDLDLSNLERGIYMLNIQYSEKYSETVKIVKQ